MEITSKSYLSICYYKGSIQRDIILLQSAKKRSSLALEGLFSEDMLSNMSSGGDSIESMLNKVLQGKLKLKEDELDTFGFESEEEVSYTFTDNNDGDVDITKRVTGKQSITVTQQEAKQMTIFTIDEEFIKKQKSKKSTPVEGQLGFLFNL